MTTAHTINATPHPVQVFLDLTQALTSLLSQENQLLQNRRPAETAALAGEKMRLTNEYRLALEKLKADEETLLGARDSDFRKKVGIATELFREELAHHAKLVIKLKTVTEGVVKSISDEVSRQRNPMQHYSHTGQMATKDTQPATLSFDRMI